MKKLLITKVMHLFCLFLITENIKAQTNTDYITFYNNTITKLNPIISNKTQFYDQPFSNFYNELQNKDVKVVGLFCDTKVTPGTKYYILKLFLSDMSMLRIASISSYNDPRISITFKDEIPNQVNNMISQYHAQWNPTFAEFFANLKIESIKFIGVRGYNSTDYSAK
ncbi:hypothetical protein [Chryseobacterium sp.]|uniref:hypothetical protein n=1 Tax=Chryseobacterium sp. TaxID=1871047 RepID=UPI0025B8BF8B|nr:hypothetical protein [Chryseobacterium sp.]